MIRTIKSFFKSIRERVMPKRALRTYLVELLLHNEADDKSFLRTHVTTTARTANDAKNNVKTFVRLHIGKAVEVKDEPKMRKG